MGKEIALYVIIAHIREKCGRIECPLFIVGCRLEIFQNSFVCFLEEGNKTFLME